MANKITKKDMFNEIITIATELDRADIIEFAKHEIELLNKKRSGESKKTKENKELAMTVYDMMVANDVHGLTCTEIIHLDATLDMSTPKMSALLKMLLADGLVTREVKGKKALFSLA